MSLRIDLPRLDVSPVVTDVARFTFFTFPRFDTGSREITLDLEVLKASMSTESCNLIVLKMVCVGSMVTGRVNVAEIMYKIAPRSNYMEESAVRAPELMLKDLR